MLPVLWKPPAPARVGGCVGERSCTGADMAHGAALAALPLAAFLARAAAFSHTPELTFDNSTGKLSGLWNGVTFPSASITSPGPAPLLGTVGYSVDFVVRMETGDTSTTGRGNPYSSEPDSPPSDYLHLSTFQPVSTSLSSGQARRSRLHR